jgi:hypothetical protein
MTAVTFVIPVRHPQNSRDWSQLKATLAQTVRSIAAQTNDDWRAVIVANEGSSLPPLPQRFMVEWVDFPPNPQHEQGSAPREAFLDAFRLDKGRRVLKGMLSARDTRFFMIVDDDDFVSARITQHAVDHPNANGWIVHVGYVWNDGGKMLYRHPALNLVCGSSLIIRSDLYQLPRTFEEASEDYIKDMLGSHRRIGALLARRGTPLEPLPFPGAIYRVGHASSHSRTPPILTKYVFNADTLRHPRQMVVNLARLRFINDAAKREFFGDVQA